MCNYSHAKAAAFHCISAISFSLEKMKGGQGNIGVKRKTKELKRKKGKGERKLAWLPFSMRQACGNFGRARGILSGEAEEFREIKGYNRLITSIRHPDMFNGVVTSP